MLHELTLASLAKLDEGPGGAPIDLQFRDAIRRIIEDAEDRPHVGDVRKLTMVLSIKPTLNEFGKVDGANIGFEFKHTMPSAKSKTYSFGKTKDNRLVFSTERLDNIHQTTFAELKPAANQD